MIGGLGISILGSLLVWESYGAKDGAELPFPALVALKTGI